MSNITKHALAESLKKLLLKKPLNKITINDLTTDCGISRMALLSFQRYRTIWSNGHVSKNHVKLSREKKTYDTWQKGLLQIFEAVYENKPFIINAYNAISREQIENSLPADPRPDHECRRRAGKIHFPYAGTEKFYRRFL